MNVIPKLTKFLRVLGVKKMEANKENDNLLEKLIWIADAPMFIDDVLLGQFYDAIVMPHAKVEDGIIVEFSEQDIKNIQNFFSGQVGGKFDPGKLLASFSSLTGLPSIEMNAELKGERTTELSTTRDSKHSYKVSLIESPQRQLVQLIAFYIADFPNRIFLVDDPSGEEWRKPEVIKEVPRQLVFLDLPGIDELPKSGLKEIQFIPTALELTNGGVKLLFDKLHAESGETPPEYNELKDISGDKKLEGLKEAHKKYWEWFSENYRSKVAMKVVEEGVGQNKIQWIDYRLPVSNDGTTLHLHICPRGRYDVGTFAYKLIKRGSKHGLRVIGTMKSGPDMNVLAIYEK